MSKVVINERITVDEPQNVELAIKLLAGKDVEFEIIRKFIVNEKNTMFYLDKKLNSSTDPGYYSDYLWIDTGFRDRNDNPIMICLHNSFDGFVGHYTAPVKKIADFVKSSNKKNARDIDNNYARFLQKYKTRSLGRNVVSIDDPMNYAVAIANRESMKSQDTAMALALQTAGVEVAEAIEEFIPEEVMEESHETFSQKEEEITVSLLLDQMEQMQGTIEELLARIENNEKTTGEELAALRVQNQEYKNALMNIRLFNEENERTAEIPEEEKYDGHNLLSHNEKILVLGNTDIRMDEMRAIARDTFGFAKTDFEFITDYDKVKNASGRIHSSQRFVAVIFGNCPHKVAGLGNYTSIIEEFKQREDCPISIDARTEAGGLKITKQSFRKAMEQVYRGLREIKVA